MTDEGPIQTGRAHPRRKSISHPYSPVPATSNADKDANRDLYWRSASPLRTPSPLRSPSPLHEPTFIEDEKPTNNEGQENPIVRRDWNRIVALELKGKKAYDIQQDKTSITKVERYCEAKASVWILRYKPLQ